MSLVKVGDHVVNLEMISAAHLEKGKLFVYLSGGRWVSFNGKDAESVWKAIQEHAGIEESPVEPEVQGAAAE